jgi:hypothetical protein
MARKAPPGRPKRLSPDFRNMHLRLSLPTLAAVQTWADAERRPVAQLLTLIVDDAIAARATRARGKPA